MKLHTLICVFTLFFAVQVQAQNKFGYLSVNEIMQLMPEYQVTLKKLTELKKEYDKEAEWTEKEFQTKFAEFLQGQSDFPDNILLKRQNELHSLMESGIKFRIDAEAELKKAEEELYAELKKKIYEAIKKVGFERNYAYILNTDADVYPFINNLQGVDATDDVKLKLGLITVREIKETILPQAQQLQPVAEDSIQQTTDTISTVEPISNTTSKDSLTNGIQ